MSQKDQTFPRLEDLGEGYSVWVTKDAMVTTDSLLLSDFCLPKNVGEFGFREHWVDIGSGTGLLPILFRKAGFAGKLTAVEVDEELAELLALSSEGLPSEQKIEILREDANDAIASIAPQSADLLVSNPPYFKDGSGAPGESRRNTSRHEGTLTLESLASCAKRVLKNKGRFCLCLPGARLAEGIEIFSGYSLTPKRLRLVESRPDKGAYLALLECRMGGRPGLEIEPVLVLNP